jgi:SAM-dependent methyltransferase
MSRKPDIPAVHSEWERFAIEDPYTYILTERKDPEQKDFWQTGYRTVHEELLPLVRAQKIATHSALEIGCGLGRLTFPLAAHFERVVGTDISPEMIRRARRFADDNGITNTEFCLISDAHDLIRQNKPTDKFDFVFSWLVFQHIPGFAAISEYLRATGVLLDGNGIGLLQFDTRPPSLAYKVKAKLPDFLLPRFWRKGIRRIRRSADEIAQEISKANLRIVGELAPSTELHRYIVGKSARRWSEP